MQPKKDVKMIYAHAENGHIILTDIDTDVVLGKASTAAALADIFTTHSITGFQMSSTIHFADEEGFAHARAAIEMITDAVEMGAAA